MSLFQQFGISPQEAKAYFALLEQDNVTGYTLSKNAGIHSSKIYGILGRLLERQFIIATDTRPVKYIPRKPDDILSAIKKDFDDSLKALSTDMNRIYNNQTKRELVTWNITKRADVFRKVRELVDQAKGHVWQAVVTHEQYYKLKDQVPVISTIPSGAGWEIQFVGDKPHDIRAEELHPNLEHAYVHYMENKLEHWDL